jgi:hypothetical protein
VNVMNVTNQFGLLSFLRLLLGGLKVLYSCDLQKFSGMGFILAKHSIHSLITISSIPQHILLQKRHLDQSV